MNEVIIYQTLDKQTQIDVRFEGDTVWLTQKQIASLFQTTPQNITIHLKRVYSEVEIEEGSTCKEYLQVQKEGKRLVKRIAESNPDDKEMMIKLIVNLMQSA